MSMDKALETVHDLLKRPFWPESLRCDVLYEINVDANTFKPGESFNLSSLYSSGNGDCCLSLDNAHALYCVPYGGGGNHREFWEALKIFTRAIQLSNGTPRVIDECEASDELRTVDNILDHLPWPSTLKTDYEYTTGSDNDFDLPPGQMTIVFTELNDGYLSLDQRTCRIYSPSGGETFCYLWSGLIVLAEAIRLENEEKGR